MDQGDLTVANSLVRRRYWELVSVDSLRSMTSLPGVYPRSIDAPERIRDLFVVNKGVAVRLGPRVIQHVGQRKVNFVTAPFAITSKDVIVINGLERAVRVFYSSTKDHNTNFGRSDVYMEGQSPTPLYLWGHCPATILNGATTPGWYTASSGLNLKGNIISRIENWTEGRKRNWMKMQGVLKKRKNGNKKCWKTIGEVKKI